MIDFTCCEPWSCLGWAAGAHHFGLLEGLLYRDQNKQIDTVSLGGKVLDRLVDGGDLEDGVQVLHLEPDGPVHGPCGGDVLVELDGLELLEGGTGQVLEEGMHHAAFLGPSLAPGRGGILAGLAGGKFLAVAENETPPVSGVESDLDRFRGVRFAGEDMGGFKKGFTGGIGTNFTFEDGSLEDGLEQGGVHGVHDHPGVGLNVWVEGDVEDTHAPGAGISIPLVEGVFEEVNFMVLFVELGFEGQVFFGGGG